MTWGATIVLIVLIAVVGRLVMTQQKDRRTAGRSEREKTALRTEISELKQRIATLEKIATDKSRRLSDQIDALGNDTTDNDGKD
ncbi:MAG: hypothetical protein WA979_00390 [Pacificimonas sp.]